MTKVILKLYSFLSEHRLLAFVSALVFTACLVVSVATLNYKEDISDFLPLDKNHQKALTVYQNISGANRLFVIVQMKDSLQKNPDRVVEAVELYASKVEKNDTLGMVKDLAASIDMERLSNISSFVYENIPYFITDEDYQRMDSLLSLPNFIGERLEQDKQMLMFPIGGLLSDNLGRDPLNLFTPIVQRLGGRDSGLQYETYEGYIFSRDMKRAILMLTSPYGSSETENNGRLAEMLENTASEVSKDLSDVDIHIIGGPVIAVGNAKQIKQDSVLSIAISVILILLLLFFCFKKLSRILLIFLSTAWGWLFAMGGLALVHNDVSVIVIGISSVIIGIAVNYPLHFVAHLIHRPNIKQALREIVMPLVVGNVTTVGAFLALTPLQSVALRDLGLFSSFLLAGTILFVLVFLPHLIGKSKPKAESSGGWLNRLASVSLDNKPIFVWGVCLLTIVMLFFSFQTKFDSNISNINYMTDSQREDMKYFQSLMLHSSLETVYVVSHAQSLDSALNVSRRGQGKIDDLCKSGIVASKNTCVDFLCSQDEQARRLTNWRTFVAKHRQQLSTSLIEKGKVLGFDSDAFVPFQTILSAKYEPMPLSHFEQLQTSVFAQNISVDKKQGDYCVIDVLKTKAQDVGKVKDRIGVDHNTFAFDVKSMNSAIANNMTADFNYIAWMCGCIVFFFLWFSLGRIELALMSFLPMAISWVWILGLMAIFDIQFNIVNVILATFIFGQGDDYTIFMTEGACYEYAYRRKMLASYKHSIIISALIMFIGIGSLIVAKHPALHALAEVTIVGMFSVVLMAYLFPPLVFKWLVSENGRYRTRPITIYSLLLSSFVYGRLSLNMGFVSILYLFERLLLNKSKAEEHRQRIMSKCFRRIINSIPTVEYNVRDMEESDKNIQNLMVINRLYNVDIALLASYNSKTLIITEQIEARNSWLIRKLYKWFNVVFLLESSVDASKKLLEYIGEGYNIIMPISIYDERDSESLKTKQEVLDLCYRHDLPIRSMVMHGSKEVYPDNSTYIYKGKVSMRKLPEIKPCESIWSQDIVFTLDSIRKKIKEYFILEAALKENTHYFRRFVLDRYIYKGVEVLREVESRLKKYDDYSSYIDSQEASDEVVIVDCGIGEFAFLYALVHKESKIVAYESDPEKLLVAQNSGEILENLRFLDRKELVKETFKGKNTYFFEASYEENAPANAIFVH